MVVRVYGLGSEPKLERTVGAKCIGVIDVIDWGRGMGKPFHCFTLWTCTHTSLNSGNEVGLELGA